jgi:hypothetical protein
LLLNTDDSSLTTESSKKVDSIEGLFYNRSMILRSGLIVYLMLSATAFAQYQYETYDDSMYAEVIAPRAELRWIMDTPTAGMLPRGTFSLDLRTFPTGGVQSSLEIGLASRFSVGVGYGASEVLADVSPEWGPRLEFLIRYRLHEESEGLPAIAVGYSSLGYGRYDEEYERYMVKSPGFYVSFSKNFNMYENPASFHWGANYSLENDKDNDPDVFIGFSTDTGPGMVFLAEYDLALNDNERYSVYGLKRGYLNIGLAWYITDELSLELDLKNLLRNREDADAIDREARLVYVEYFY